MPENKPKRKINLLVDFDNTINSYASGWKGFDVIPDPPNDGCKEALDELSKHFRIIIFSVRAKTEAGRQGIVEYMKKYNLPHGKITDTKLPGLIIDDLALQFKTWPQVLKDISNFKQRKLK